MSENTRVRFLHDDHYGLWRAGDVADDLGWEQRCQDGTPLPEDHPDFLPIRLLRLRGELISLTDPYRRGLIEAT